MHGIGPNGIILPKKKRIYKSLNDYLEITVPKIDEVLDYYYEGDHLLAFDSTSCYALRAVVTLDEVPTDIDNMLFSKLSKENNMISNQNK